LSNIPDMLVTSSPTIIMSYGFGLNKTSSSNVTVCPFSSKISIIAGSSKLFGSGEGVLTT